EAGQARRVPPRAHGPTDPGPGRHHGDHRKGPARPAANEPGGAAKAAAEAGQGRFHAGRLPQAVRHDAADGRHARPDDADARQERQGAGGRAQEETQAGQEAPLTSSFPRSGWERGRGWEPFPDSLGYYLIPSARERLLKGETVAVRIRMKQRGRKHRPYYRIV